MKVIRSIVNTYNSTFKSSCADPILDSLNENEKLAWRIILENDGLNDSQLNTKIAKVLYDNSPHSNAYKTFKRNFAKKLRRIVTVSISKGSEMQKDAFELMDDYNAMMKLLYTGYYKASMHLAETLLNRAIKFQNYFLAKSICLLLLKTYGTHQPARRKKYVDKYDELEITCHVEYKSILLFTDLVSWEIEGDITEEQRAFVTQNIENLKLKLPYDSIVYHYYYYQIQLKVCEKAEYEKWCREAVDHFEGLWYKHTYYVSLFRNRLMDFYLRTGEYAKAELNLITLLDDTKDYSIAWYRFAITFIAVNLKLAKNEIAREWYSRLVRSKKYRAVPKALKNELEILGMYLHVAVGEIENISIRKIKYNLNADKAYLAKENIQFLVGEIAYLILSGKVDVDAKVNHLRKVVTNSKKNVERCLAYCDYIDSGKPFDIKDDSQWKDEILSYEQLIKIVKAKVVI